MAATEKRGRLRYDAETERLRYGWVGHGYEEILLEMAGWMAKNPELVAEDEWLGKIAQQMADNEQLMKVLSGEKEDES